VLGDPTAGLAQARRGVAGLVEVTPAPGGFTCRMLAELYLATGDTSAGLTTVEEGLDLVAKTGDAGVEAELWRSGGTAPRPVGPRGPPRG
jgi:hypothetical protein